MRVLAALDGLSRLHIALPPLLVVALLLTLFLLTSVGETRLHLAGDTLERSARRQQTLVEFASACEAALAAERGYRLTGSAGERAAFDAAARSLGERLERVRSAYAKEPASRADVADLTRATGTQMAALAAAMSGTAAADDEGAGRLRVLLDRMRARESLSHAAAAGVWSASLRLSHWLTIAGTLFNMLLVGIASRLVYIDARRRAASVAALSGQKQALEREVEERTRDLAELSTHLQSIAEHEKERLAHELHDELGGLLVGARMDVSWAEQQLSGVDPAVKQRLTRVQQSLAAGVDLKRRIIEELRPTLLDNVGLVAALRWQLKESCGRAGLRCIERYPDEETVFTAEASIALFRIAQESFTNILKHAAASTVTVSLDIDRQQVVLRIADDGQGIPAGRTKTIGTHGFASMRHRILALAGNFDVANLARHGTAVTATVPAANAVVATPGVAAG